MLSKILIWIMRFVLLGLIYVFLYKVIKVMYNDIRGGRVRKGATAGIEVVEVKDNSIIPVGSVYLLHPITSIGRGPDNSIVLDSQYVSGSHAKIYLKNNAYLLKDTGSTNGTYLNGVKIDKPVAIKNEDRIDIGGIVFKVIG